jgi:DNA-binding PadR family transcriptional regulator
MRLILRPALLLLLAEGDSHGYELMDQLEPFGFDPECMDSSIVYRDLRDMEEMGLIQSTWDDDSKGPKRRVYQIQEEGLDRLGGWLDSLDRVRDQIEILQKRYQTIKNQKEKE